MAPPATGRIPLPVSIHNPTRAKRPKLRLIIEDEAPFNRHKKMAGLLNKIGFKRGEISKSSDGNWNHPSYVHYEVTLAEVKKYLSELGKEGHQGEIRDVKSKNEELWVSHVFKEFLERFDNEAFSQELFMSSDNHPTANFTNHENRIFEVEVCCLSYLREISKRWNNPHQSNLLQDPSYYFWVVDSDGLNLSLETLNHANAVTVLPLKTFFEVHLNDVPSYNNLFGALTHNNQHSFHHYILVLHPNAEVFSYTFSNESRSSLAATLIDDTENKLFKAIIRPSMIGTSKGNDGLPFFKLNEDNIQGLKRGFINGDSSTPEGLLFLPLDEDEFKHYFSWKSGGKFDFVAGAWYLRKPPNKILPLLSLEQELNRGFVENQFTLYKWTVEPGEPKSSRFVTSWSDPRFCNSRTNIRISDLGPEWQELYGNGLDGFKPCERHTGGASRCYQHR
ncbi:hypothetical protein N9M68_04120 [Candidatus Poseidonia alphae]|nr:hypothetical protein [Candidatus Poseidonia alphae]